MQRNSSTAITELNLPVIEAASQEGKSQPLSGSASTSVTNEKVHPGTGEDSKGAAQQFSMDDGLPPVPAKVVDKILSGPANTQRSPRPGQLAAVLWCVCQCDGEQVSLKDHPAYQTIIICEARRCGGGGWQGYDRMFRQQAALSPGLDWSQVNSSLFAVTFLAQQNGRGKTC